ncbi:hypothetical protein ACFYY3_12140 [Streptomyces sp. NPDC001812]|uniref:Uncharacterized protein n=1 Tax=Streptomyces cathayae TaxID=3031124 RepID=A0ABY8JYN9_9ACTN|nr:hypothetical protein [Streptomyces sp. HUAS 5]WGD41115.1 hypothetical protein PYS65_13635 [Streptomyces sp. HUAS 5]
MPDMSASASLAMSHLVTLAEVDKDKVTPGVLGFIVFAVMALAVWGLMKSMTRHMNRVDFDEPAARRTGSDDATEPASSGAAEKKKQS